MGHTTAEIDAIFPANMPPANMPFESNAAPLLGSPLGVSYQDVKQEIEDLHPNVEEEGPYGTLQFDTPDTGLTEAEVARRAAQYGPNALPEKVKNPILEFLKHFWGPMPIMIWIAII